VHARAERLKSLRADLATAAQLEQKHRNDDKVAPTVLTFMGGGAALGALALGVVGARSALQSGVGWNVAGGALMGVLGGALAGTFAGMIVMAPVALLRHDRRSAAELDPRVGELDQQITQLDARLLACKNKEIDQEIAAGNASAPTPQAIPGGAG
jgi:hypothetical protein